MRSKLTYYITEFGGNGFVSFSFERGIFLSYLNWRSIMKAVIISKADVSYYVNVVNDLIEEIDETSKSLFESFHSAYKNLTTNEFENEFIPKIKMDRSSSNKMKKICKSDFIVRNRDLLPKSWATLYVLVNIEESDLQKLVDVGLVTTDTTKKQMLEIRDKINSPIDEDEYDNLMDASNDDSYNDSDDKSTEYDDGTDDNSVSGRDKHWVGMPSFNNNGNDGNDGSFRKLIIKFKEEEDFDDFISLVGALKVTEKTKSVWYKKSAK